MDYLFIVRDSDGRIVKTAEAYGTVDFVGVARVVMRSARIASEAFIKSDACVECCEVWQISEDENEMKKIITIF